MKRKLDEKSSSYKANDNKLISTLQDRLYRMCFTTFNKPIMHNKRFPGAMPYTLTRKNLIRLQSSGTNENNTLEPYLKDIFAKSSQKIDKSFKEKWYFTKKSNGVRYLLMIIFHESEPMQILWDRKMQPQFVKFDVPEFMYKDSLIDLEVIGSKAYILDVIAVNGKSLIDYPLTSRLKVMKEIPKLFKNVSESPFTICYKKFYPVSSIVNFLMEETNNNDTLTSRSSDVITKIVKDFNEICLDKKKIEHLCDGLYFLEGDKPIQFGTCPNQFKFKLPENCTIDFKLIFKDGKVGFYMMDNNELQLFCEYVDMFIPVMYHDKIVECAYINGMFTPKLIREDKLVPNNKYIVEDTLRAIKDNITLENVINTIFY